MEQAAVEQCRHVAAAWEPLVAAIAARETDPHERWQRTRRLRALGEVLPRTGASLPRSTSTTMAATGILWDQATRRAAPEAEAVLLTFSSWWSERAGQAQRGERLVSSDGAVAADLLIDGAGGPYTDEDPETIDLPLLERLAAITARRPWTTNPVFTNLSDGSYTREQAAVFADQWQYHLETGPALFAGLLASSRHHALSATERAQLSRLVFGTDPEADRRVELGEELGQLCVHLREGRGERDRPLPEATGHLGLIRSLTRLGTFTEACAAILSVKPGFGDACRTVANSMRQRYGVAEDSVPFFTAQSEGGDDGAFESTIVAQARGTDRDTQDRVVAAYAAGLASYHLVLDGCHRAALMLPGHTPSSPLEADRRPPPGRQSS